eukprot:m.11669 g.11669  ORF g.11669 m.11669 type:complete len:58 (+) comp9869_c0_seq1:23-196(+)
MNSNSQTCEQDHRQIKPDESMVSSMLNSSSCQNNCTSWTVVGKLLHDHCFNSPCLSS